MTCLKLTLGLAIATATWAASLPGRYFELLEAGSRQVESRLASDPAATLETLEQTPEWRHFGYCVLAPAVRHKDTPKRHF